MLGNIDFVLPWVDSSDAVWQKEKEKHDTNTLKTYNNSSMRFKDWGTLKYVLRGIEQNCAWYNKIYIITEGHVPVWLDIGHEKITLVAHKELYIKKEHLPVFNSSSIEMNLVNIKGLSDKFIYLNDDTLILKKINKDRFFKDGKPVDFISHGWLPRNSWFEKLRGMNSWAHSLKNNIRLINAQLSPLQFNQQQLYHQSYSLKTKVSNFLLHKVYKEFLWLEHWHHPMPYLKSTLNDVYALFEEEMMLCSSNRFRSNTDLTQYIYRYWQLANGNFHPHQYNDGLYCKIQSKKDIDSCLKKIKDFTFFCPNDALPDDILKEDYQYIKTELINNLKKLLPKKSTFEK